MVAQNVQTYNLPPQPTPFIGREPEIADIIELLHDDNCRLLTLLGSGGMGKTRLSIESVQRLSHNEFEHGVYYIPLAPLTSADNIVTTVISVLGIMIGDDGTPQEELAKFLSGRNLLLVMDNFEHLLDGANLVANILNSARNVKILVTSREALNLRMERVWHVRGMRYPATEQLDNLENYSALNLFIHRATWVRRDFSAVDEQASMIRICQLVGGMPLAIELSASWLKTLSCQDIIKEIEQGLDFLSTRARDIPERHRSVRAVFDQSWSLLSVGEQTVFPRLSVFRGGFTRDAAVKVADADLMILSGLVEKSMVRHDSTGRYDLHELLRQYAEEKLDTLDEVNIYIEHHMHYFGTFMADRAPDIKGKRQVDSLNEIAADFDNILEAWRQGIYKADGDVLDDMMETLALFADIRATYVVGENLFREAITNLLPSDMNPLIYNRLQARYIQVWVLPEKRPIPDHITHMIENCLKVAENNSDEMTVLLCLWLQGELYRIDEDAENSLLSYEQAQDLSIKLQSPYYEGRVLRGIDFLFIYDWIDDPQYEIEVSHRQQELTSQMSDINGLAHAVFYIGIKNTLHGKLDTAQKHLDVSYANWQAVKDLKSMGVTTAVLGLVAFLKGDFEDAQSQLTKSMQLQVEKNYLANNTMIYSTLGRINIMQGDYNRARELFERAVAYSSLRHRSDTYISNDHAFLAIVTNDYEFIRKNLHKIFSGNKLHYVLSTSIVLVSFVLHRDNEYVRATEILGLALEQMSGITQWAQKWDLLTQLRNELESELGIETYQASWERGAQLDLNETVAVLLVYLGNDDKLDSAQPKSQPLAEQLTERELEVLVLVADGLTNPQIAEKLYLSTGTVKVHTRNIYGKLSVSNRTEAVVVAQKLNLI